MPRKFALVASLVRGLALGLLVLGPATALAQYPSRPVKLIVPFPPARATDVVGRLGAADVQERFASVGAEPVGSTPQVFVERIRSDAARWGEVIKAANVQVR